MAVARIEVFGPGCKKCQETYRVVKQVVEQTGVSCEVVKVESIEAMARRGIMSTPAIVADGVVVMTGKVPSPQEVRRLLGFA
jgi:small redox-active disulfide protein 2